MNGSTTPATTAAIEFWFEFGSNYRLPPQQIIDEAQSEANKLRLRQQTEAAAGKGIFGAPMCFVGDDMFWGNERLDDALVRCTRERA